MSATEQTQQFLTRVRSLHLEHVHENKAVKSVIYTYRQHSTISLSLIWHKSGKHLETVNVQSRHRWKLLGNVLTYSWSVFRKSFCKSVVVDKTLATFLNRQLCEKENCSIIVVFNDGRFKQVGYRHYIIIRISRTYFSGPAWTSLHNLLNPT